jgi:hypothetical protein
LPSATIAARQLRSDTTLPGHVCALVFTRNLKKTNSLDSAHGNAFERECDEYFAAGAAYEPPTFDADGYPLDDGGSDE